MTHGPVFHLTDAWLQANFPTLKNFAHLNQGGQKLVFSATHATEGEVVLKIVQPTQSLEDVEREVLAVQRVQSPRVPAILGHGSVASPLGQAYWIREQRIRGETLAQILQRGPLPPREVIKLGTQMLEALVRAEAVRIVHRDVKPDNIMRDPSGDFWLLDFGLARHLTLASLTATGLPFGKLTWGYSPPEQCRNNKREIDARSDLFALGITLYEAGTGINPFRIGARDNAEMLRRVENDALPPLSLALTAGDQFRDFVAVLTQKRRDHRPASAAEADKWLNDVRTAEGM
jgi:serine/threonine protein kinase